MICGRVSAVVAAALIVLSVFAVAGCQTAENLRAAQPPRPSADRPLRVLSFNIRLGLGQRDPKGDIYRMDWGRDLDGVIVAIRAFDPDIAGLQEVAGTDQMRRIAAALDMNYAFQWHGTGSSRPPWWGVGILSKYWIKSATGAEISSGRGDTRHMAMATLDVDGRDLMAVSIHKDKDLGDGRSMANVLRIVADAKMPIILIGDFNVTPGDPRLDGIKKRFLDTAAADTDRAGEARRLGTFFRSRRRIDYVFADKDHFDVVDAGLLPPEYRRASDHIGYYSTLSLKRR